ncbi:MAG: dihydrolipoamide acetyltransferase family protein [Acetobacteraceae bacterium]
MPGEPANIFLLPDLGEGLREAEVVVWHVAEGDHVVADQPLVSVETDKAVVEIPSPRAGRIAKLLADLHAHLPIGAPLVAFDDDAQDDAGSVVGTLPATHPVVPPRATPAVRALAARRGIDLSTLNGSGPSGEITRADLDRAHAPQGGAEPLSGYRRAMAQRMELAKDVVSATVTDEADVSNWPHDADITARLVAALVVGCRTEPALNCTFDARAMTRRSNPDVHVGIAVDTDDGLIVPVLRDAARMAAADVEQHVGELVMAARTRRSTPATLRGATITLSNFGSLGGRYAHLVVVPPQVAILGAGCIHAAFIPASGGYAATRILPLSLTFDHRVVTGGEAARFLNAVKSAMEAHA